MTWPERIKVEGSFTFILCPALSAKNISEKTNLAWVVLQKEIFHDEETAPLCSFFHPGLCKHS